MKMIGDLLVRLASGEGWDFVAFGRDDEVIVSGTSGHEGPDMTALRAEVRLQRFAGAVLPHVSTPLASEQRRALYVLFGEFGDYVAIIRIFRAVGAKPYATRDGANIERFFRQHADAIGAAIFDEVNEETDRLAMRRAPPIAFIIDANGALLSTLDEPDGDPNSLRTHFMPRNGEVPVVLRSAIADLLERHRSGATESGLVAVLPFALVRLSPLRSRGAQALLVTFEWLRSRASLEVTAAQYAISKRELQVLAAMLRGAPVSAIAAELSISESTVVFHLKRMLKKTASKNRTELAARMLGWEIPA